MSDSVRRDAIRVMKTGGQQIAEEAQEKWWSGKYSSDLAQRTEMVKHWKAVYDEVNKIAKEMQPRTRR